MSETVLERAARALAVNNGMDAEAWGRWEDDARAVLTAIREPFQSFDEPMAKAGADIIGVGQHKPIHWTNYDQARRVWQAMIDAALKEGS